MFARIFPICIVGFWLLMTGLMIKRIHFPGSTKASSVPVTLVMDTFFGQDSPGGQYDLLQSSREIGIVTIIPRERQIGEDKVRQIVLWNGGSNLRIRWSAIVTLSKDSGSLAGIDLEASIVGADFEFEIKARPESETVDYIVRQKGQVIADSNASSGTNSLQAETARALLSSWGFSGDADSEDGQSGGMKGYEEVIDIAGRQREVYSLVASLGPGRDITMYFSRAGELLKVVTFLDYELRPSAIILDS